LFEVSVDIVVPDEKGAGKEGEIFGAQVEVVALEEFDALADLAYFGVFEVVSMSVCQLLGGIEADGSVAVLDGSRAFVEYGVKVPAAPEVDDLLAGRFGFRLAIGRNPRLLNVPADPNLTACRIRSSGIPWVDSLSGVFR
jgi:hypothetical protein